VPSLVEIYSVVSEMKHLDGQTLLPHYAFISRTFCNELNTNKCETSLSQV